MVLNESDCLPAMEVAVQSIICCHVFILWWLCLIYLYTYKKVRWALRGLATQLVFEGHILAKSLTRIAFSFA